MIEEQLAQYAMGRHYIIATGRAFNGQSETGGWAVVVQLREDGSLLKQRCLAAQQTFTTDNRVTMHGAIEGLSHLNAPLPAIIISDSKYLVQGMTGWLADWKEARWQNCGGPVKNRDLWEELDALDQARPSSEWLNAKGHPLHGLNETADAVAKEAAKGMYQGGEQAIRKRHPWLFR